MITIINIIPGSIADKSGIKPGDQLLTINEQEIHDYIDYRYYGAEEVLNMTIHRQGHSYVYEIEKEYDEDVGLILEEMKLMCCGNNCLFCFVHQNPKGMRRALYVKDEDYRFSFLYGNYITLTRVDDLALNRIIQQKLSPLYVSVHATDWAVRKLLLGLKKDDNLIDKLIFLTKNGIEIHAQIVVCPGINDGSVLGKTIGDLAKFYPGVGSVAIVPVGLTRHRARLYPLRILTKNEIKNMILYVNKMQKIFRRRIKTGFVYLSDEFFIRAGFPVPGEDYYDDFYQIENGVGEFRRMISELEHVSSDMSGSLNRPVKISWITGRLAYEPLKRYILSRFDGVINLTIQLIPITNDFFGKSITVSGLLVGGDIYYQLKGRQLGDLVLLPPRIVNHEGYLLDNWTPAMLQDKLNVPVHVYTEPFSELVNVVEKYL